MKKNDAIFRKFMQNAYYKNIMKQTFEPFAGHRRTDGDCDVNGVFHADTTPGRNDKCPCGSGLKYKKCCGGVQ